MGVRSGFGGGLILAASLFKGVAGAKTVVVKDLEIFFGIAQSSDVVVFNIKRHMYLSFKV